MRHRVHGRKLGRTSAHRKALFRNQLAALFTHDRIITTVAKAKELRPVAERMVTLARTGTLTARRKVATMVPDNEVAKRLFEEIAPRFADRPGGYTRIMRLGRRHGDNAELAIIEFVDYELSEHAEGGEAGGKESFMDRAKGMFGGGTKAAVEEVDDEAPSAEAEVETEAEADTPAIEAEPVIEESPAAADEPEEQTAGEAIEETATDVATAEETVKATDDEGAAIDAEETAELAETEETTDDDEDKTKD